MARSGSKHAKIGRHKWCSQIRSRQQLDPPKGETCGRRSTNHQIVFFVFWFQSPKKLWTWDILRYVRVPSCVLNQWLLELLPLMVGWCLDWKDLFHIISLLFGKFAELWKSPGLMGRSAIPDVSPHARFCLALHKGFLNWRYPNSWMAYTGKCIYKWMI